MIWGTESMTANTVMNMWIKVFFIYLKEQKVSYNDISNAGILFNSGPHVTMLGLALDNAM